MSVTTVNCEAQNVDLIEAVSRYDTHDLMQKCQTEDVTLGILTDFG